MNPEDWGFLIWLAIPLLILVLTLVMPCLGAATPLLGVVLLALAIPRSGYARIMATQLLAVEVVLFVVGLLGQLVCSLAKASSLWGCLPGSLVALAMAALVIRSARLRQLLYIPILTGLTFHFLFQGERRRDS